ncbi:hypothetical protein TNCV_1300671 [Trichonephila clavipes]|nr:hypothetical protein TNCV_1300671 [Trichonephila clavipes]
MRRGHLRHIDIQSENCRQLYTLNTYQRRSSIPLNSSQGTLLLHVVRGVVTRGERGIGPPSLPNRLRGGRENPPIGRWLRWKGEGEMALPPYPTDGDRFNKSQVICSQFGLAIHQNDHQTRRRFVEWAQNEIAVVPDFHKRILFSDEAHFWLNGYVNKQNCCIWSEANPQVYVETPLHPEKLTVWCALWAGGILLQK